MSHDDFLKLLADLDLDGAEKDPGLEALLPPEAAGHAAACESCARTARALLVLATSGEALAEEPPAGYWDDFDARLEARLAAGLEARDRPVPTEGAGQLWRVAAMLLLAAGLAAFVLLRGDPEPSTTAQRVETPVDAWGELLTAWGGEDETSAAPSPPSPASAPSPPSGVEEDLEDGALPGVFGAPVDSLHAELSLELDDHQAAALARALRADIAS